MKLTEYALVFLKEYISGDNSLTPRLSGSKLIELFNSVGFKDVYSMGMPDGMSRNVYVLDRLKKINNSKELKTLLEMIFSPRHFSLDETLDIKIPVERVNKLISTEGYHFIENKGQYFISSKDAYPENTSSEVFFEELRQLLITEVSKAKYTIWVAVAWFTDKELYDLLITKRNNGVNVQVLILDDEINNKPGLNFGKDFYTLRVKKQGPYENIMHHKFCIVDLKTVIHGSYNWTIKAQYNRETLDVETNRENAEKFADQFIKLKTEAI
jgi:phosphatidylserine/phosphatidylglycerophosphate/cardiolipin synthase-like enzyme